MTVAFGRAYAKIVVSTSHRSHLVTKEESAPSRNQFAQATHQHGPRRKMNVIPCGGALLERDVGMSGSPA